MGPLRVDTVDKVVSETVFRVRVYQEQTFVIRLLAYSAAGYSFWVVF